MATSEPTDKIVVTTKEKRSGESGQCVVWLERVPGDQVDTRHALHDARGVVVNKASVGGDHHDTPQVTPWHSVTQFKVFLADTTSEPQSAVTEEVRRVSFLFVADDPRAMTEEDREELSREYFVQLTTAADFPRDYVGFITKMIRLMRHRPWLCRVELCLRQVGEVPPGGEGRGEGRGEVKLSSETVLDCVERAYPNSVTPEAVLQLIDPTAGQDAALAVLEVLRRQRLVRQMADGSFVRATHNDADVRLVRQVPRLAQGRRPTVAVVTSLYVEKVAVDAMLTSPTTYLRCRREGASDTHVYTVGQCGAHWVVSTKLPTVGPTREALIAAGNATTRLLGTFQRVEHVFVVGCGGAVPRQDLTTSVRRGDVVLSSGRPSYVYVEPEEAEVGRRSWSPTDDILSLVAAEMKQDAVGESLPPWSVTMQHVMTSLQQTDVGHFTRPDTDELHLSLGGHSALHLPQSPPGDTPVLHLGTVAGGRHVTEVQEVPVVARDAGFDAVMEAIEGSRKDSFMLVRGVADYTEGQEDKEWQPYSALAAAAVMKCIVERLPPPQDSDEEEEAL